MLIYYVFMALLLVGMIVNKWIGAIRVSCKFLAKNSVFTRLNYWYVFFFLFIIMGFKDVSVGTDTRQYLRYYNVLVPSYTWAKIFSMDEPALWIFNKILFELGVPDQCYIAIVGLFFSSVFVWFFEKYSLNLFYSIFLHMTIGLFSMSMSGIRQTFAVCLCLLAFDCMRTNKRVISLIWISIAYFFHNSAISFLIVFIVNTLFRNRKMSLRFGLLLWVLCSSLLFIQSQALQIVYYFLPDRYMDYSLTDTRYPINPLLVLIAMAMPLACLFVQRCLAISASEFNSSLFSELYVLSICNMAFNILAMNTNMFNRIAFYFLPFVLCLISNSIYVMRDAREKVLAYMVGFSLPLYQFVKGAEGGGTLGILYKFFFL